MVSIPNGMEFYTKIGHNAIDRQIVSIPNGMEFYEVLSLRWSDVNCFNSQRDGILQYLTNRGLYAIASFNSQRDGILLEALE